MENTNSFIHIFNQYNHLISEVNFAISKVEKIYKSMIKLLESEKIISGQSSIQVLSLKKLTEIHNSTFLYNLIHSPQKDEAYQIWLHFLESYIIILEESAELMENILELAKPLPSVARQRLTNSANEIILLVNKSGTYAFCHLRKAWNLTYRDAEFLLDTYDKLVKYRNVCSLLTEGPSEEKESSVTTKLQINISLLLI